MGDTSSKSIGHIGHNSLVTIRSAGYFALRFVQIKLPFSFQISYDETVSIPKNVSGSSLSSFEGLFTDTYRCLSLVINMPE